MYATEWERRQHLNAFIEWAGAVPKKGDVVEFGDWESCEADSGLSVMTGVYTYAKWTTMRPGRERSSP